MTIKVSGLAEMHKTMQELPSKIEANIVRGALRAGQRVVMTKAKELAPTDSGALRDSIRIRINRRAGKKGFVRVDLMAGNFKAWYAHLIEFGTASFYNGSGQTVGGPYIIKGKEGGIQASRSRKRKALKVGASFVDQVTHPGIKPKPFMRPAVDASMDDAIEAVSKYFRTRVPKEVAKQDKVKNG